MGSRLNVQSGHCEPEHQRVRGKQCSTGTHALKRCDVGPLGAIHTKWMEERRARGAFRTRLPLVSAARRLQRANGLLILGELCVHSGAFVHRHPCVCNRQVGVQ